MSSIDQTIQETRCNAQECIIRIRHRLNNLQEDNQMSSQHLSTQIQDYAKYPIWNKLGLQTDSREEVENLIRNMFHDKLQNQPYYLQATCYYMRRIMNLKSYLVQFLKSAQFEMEHVNTNMRWSKARIVGQICWLVLKVCEIYELSKVGTEFNQALFEQCIVKQIAAGQLKSERVKAFLGIRNSASRARRNQPRNAIVQIQTQQQSVQPAQQIQSQSQTQSLSVAREPDNIQQTDLLNPNQDTSDQQSTSHSNQELPEIWGSFFADTSEDNYAQLVRTLSDSDIYPFGINPDDVTRFSYRQDDKGL